MRFTTTAAALTTALAVLAACGGDGTSGGSTAPADGPRPIVVDTDAGLDDAIALLYLASSPDVDLRAVTVSGTGLAHCPMGARNVVGLLELAGRADVPVACGAETPVDAAGREFPADWRRGADVRFDQVWPVGQTPLDDRSAAELLATSVRESPRPVTLLTLGPLTNVAHALELDDDLGGNVDRLVAMAGAFDVPGNTDGPAEWNVYADPLAARTVARSGLPLTFVPLDATNAVPLDAPFLRAVASAPQTDVVVVTRDLLFGVRDLVAGGEYYLWDPLAAVLSVHPELGTAEQRAADVVVDGADSGRTIEADDGAAAEVFTAADGRATERALLERLAGRPVPPIDERPDVVIDSVGCSATSPADLAAGARFLHLEPVDPSGWVVVGTLAPEAGPADIEAYFAEPPSEEPDWFTPAAFLGGAADAPRSDVALLERGEYTVICIEGDWETPKLRGTSTFTVG
jgi:pyrimidine-specific ribonucleoside hydrolase